MKEPQALAFDFDGVLCNGLKEYFQTAWRVYQMAWPVSYSTPPAELAEKFYRLRPVVEVGWEMPVVLRAVLQGLSEDHIIRQWPTLKYQLIEDSNLTQSELGQQVDGTRDRWIQKDLEGWLSLHSFYPGVLDKLRGLMQAKFPYVIITTKESRFVRQLLQREGIVMPENSLYGKDCGQPKAQTLQSLQSQLPSPIWFLEDRIKTLNTVKAEPELANTGLFLVDWGYNLETERQQALADPRLNLLTLNQFQQDCSSWLMEVD